MRQNSVVVDSAEQPTEEADQVVLRVPRRNRVKTFAIASAALAIAVGFGLAGYWVAWAFAMVLVPVFLVQVLLLFRGETLTVTNEFLRTVDALGRRRTYRFADCGPFVPWANPMEPGVKAAPHRLVVFDYDGPEKLPLLASANKRLAGGNAFVNAAFGLDSGAMADLLNERPSRAVSPEDWLVEAVSEFVDCARSADSELRRFMVESGMRPTDRSMAYAWHDSEIDVEQRGELPGGHYYFHGLGCAIKLGDEAGVDIDWRVDASIVLDPWKVCGWVRELGRGEPGASDVADALTALVARGEVAENRSDREFWVSSNRT